MRGQRSRTWRVEVVVRGSGVCGSEVRRRLAAPARLADSLHRAATLTGAALLAALLCSGLLVTAVVHLQARRTAGEVSAAAALRQAHEGMLDQETGLRGWLLTADPQFLQPFQAGRREYDEGIAGVRRAVGRDSGVAAGLDGLGNRHRQWATWAAPHLAPPAAPGRIDAADLSLGRHLFDAYRAEEARLASRLDARIGATGPERALLLAGGVLEALCLLAAGLFARRQHARLAADVIMPVRQLVAAMRRVGDGRLDAATLPRRDDGPAEIAQVREGFRRMVAQLAAEREASEADALTGLYNRRRLDADLEREAAAHDRAGRPLSLLLVDLDHFKRVNDTLGHAAGDAVLRRVGALLTADRRAGDSAYRYGGEEFAVLLRDTGTVEAAWVAERLRARVALGLLTDGVAGGGRVPVTCSIGVAQMAGRGGGPDEALNRADQALYGAKAAGRNRVVVCPPGDGEGSRGTAGTLLA